MHVAERALCIGTTLPNEDMIQATEDGAVTLYYDAAAKIATTSTGATVTGNLGIGTASPDADLSLISPAYTSGGAGNGIRFQNQNNSADAIIQSYYSSTSSSALLHSSNVYLSTSASFTPFDTNKSSSYMLQNTNGNIEFGNGSTGAPSEKMRIDTSGTLLIGRTNTDSNTGGHFITDDYAFFEKDGAPLFVNRFGSNGTAVQFRRQNSNVGDIYVTTSGTAYNTSSDYRLKTAVTYDWDATTRLKQLKPARFKWISDGDDAVFVDGFIADEAQTVVPESVTGTKDEVDADGNPVMQGIDQAKLVPLLCKTILELEARITALEAE